MSLSDQNRAAGGTDWVRVALLVFAGTATALHIGKVPPAVPLLQSELNLSLLTLGWVLSLLAASGAVLGIATGVLVSRLGQERAVLFGLMLLVLGSLFGAAATGAVTLLLARGTESFGLILVVIAAPGLMARTAAPRDQGVALALWATWVPLGMGTMMLVSAAFLGTMGWRGSWLLAAGLTALAVVLMLRRFSLTAPTPRRQDEPSRFAALRETAKHPGPWLLTSIFHFYSMSFLALFGYLPTFLVETGVSQGQAIVMTAIAVYCNALGSLTGGALLRHGWLRWRLVAIACVAMAVCGFGIFSGDPPVWVKYALSMAFSGFGGLIPATVFSSIPLFAERPDQMNAVNGMIVQGIYSGQLIGPPILAFLIGVTGGWSPAAPLFLAATCTAGFIASLGLRRVVRRTVAATASAPEAPAD